MNPPFDLSVVLAEAPGSPDVESSLGALERAAGDLTVQVIVVRPPGGDAIPTSARLSVRELPADPRTLVPERWGVGFRACTAPVVACLTTELEVSPDWTLLLRALRESVVGCSGTLRLSAGAGSVATALYLARFSACLPRRHPADSVVSDIPGDGAIYVRDAVMQHAALLDTGFWEAEFHRRFRKTGAQTMLIPEPLVTYRPKTSLSTAMHLRMRHGRGYGVTRVRDHGEHPLRVVLFAPAVPFVMLGRTLARSRRSALDRSRVWRAVPALLALLGAWACGEAIGAMSIGRG